VPLKRLLQRHPRLQIIRQRVHRPSQPPRHLTSHQPQSTLQRQTRRRDVRKLLIESRKIPASQHPAAPRGPIRRTAPQSLPAGRIRWPQINHAQTHRRQIPLGLTAISRFNAAPDRQPVNPLSLVKKFQSWASHRPERFNRARTKPDGFNSADG
jgi:hypothetical protein